MPQKPSRSSKKPGEESQTRTLKFDSTDSAHLEKWRLYMLTETQKLYGKISTIFINQKYPAPTPLPNSPEAPWTDATDPGGIQREYLKQKVSLVLKEEEKIKDLKKKMYGYIKDHLSTASMTQVKRHVIQKMADLAMEDEPQEEDEGDGYSEVTPDDEVPAGEEEDDVSSFNQSNERTVNTLTAKSVWDEFEITQDPLELWKAIRSTHQTARLLSSRLDQDRAMLKFSTMRQSDNESLDSYKLRFDNALDTLSAVNLKPPSTKMVVTRFVESLNNDYAELRKEIKNSEYKGSKNAWPATLDAAYVYATKFLTNEIVERGDKFIALVAPASSITEKRKGKPKGKENDSSKTKCNPTLKNDPKPTPTTTATPTAPAQQTSNVTEGQPNHGLPNGNQKSNDTTQTKQPKNPCILCGEMHWIFLHGVKERISNGEIEARTCVTKLVSLTSYSTFAENEVLIDNASNMNIFRDRSLLTDVKQLNAPISVGGVNAKGEPLVATERGSYGPFKNVFVNPDAIGNILSWGKARDELHLSYDADTDKVTVDTRKGIYEFSRVGDFYTRIHTETCLLSKRQVDLLNETQTIQARLGFPEITELYNTVKIGGINNLPITSTDVLQLRKANSSKAEILGKMTKPSPTADLPTDWFATKVNQGTLAVDIRSINGQQFLLGLVQEITLTLITHLHSKYKEDLQEALSDFIELGKKHNWEFIMRSDGEGSPKAAIQKLNIRNDICGPDRHIPVIERRIRTVKERVRGILNALPFTLPMYLLKYLVYFVVSRLNLLSSTSSFNEHGNRPAYELFYNRKIDYKRDLRVAFGDFAFVYEYKTKNTMNPRGRGAIALYPTNNSSGSVLFYIPSTNSLVTRDKWVSSDLTQDVIDSINKLASRHPKSAG